MKLADVSIKRPVFATMIIAAIVVFGVVLYRGLTVDMFPNVNFPVVTVTVVYPGADPETMETQVANPVEEALNSLSGIRSLRSTSLEGVAQVFVEFDLKISVDRATQDVRDRLSAIQQQLPDGAEAPNVQKLDLGAAPIMQLAVSGSGDAGSLARYGEERLKPALERIPGVGQVELVGGQGREMHVWLDPDALRARALTVGEVVNALRSQNIGLPAGRLSRGDRELTVRTNAQARNVADFERLAITTANGGVIRLGDVARVEDGLEEQRSVALVNDRAAIAVVIRKQSDANTVEVARLVSAELPALQASAPAGTQIEMLVDNSINIRGSIETVQLDLVLGAFLAVAIIFIFLRDPRATIISALALPTSVIGTFGFVKLMGFTLNMMTTLALSLSIGILIDDAIVVIENIVRRRTALKENPMEAAGRGTAEIGLAVLATTLSLVAVFVPVAFMEGLLGQFFFEFGLTVAFAVLLSLFVSFTLTPMLSSRFLGSHSSQPRGISAVIERGLVGLESGYRRLIRWALRRRFTTVGLAVAALIGTLALAPFLGFEFIPAADTGQFSVKLELPTGTSLQEAAARSKEIAAKIRKMPGVTSTFTTVGGGAQEKVNRSDITVTLAPRAGRQYHQTAAMGYVRKLLGDQHNVKVSVEALAAVGGGGGRTAAVQLDLRGGDLASLATVATQMAERLRAAGGYVDVDTTFSAGKPELEVEVDPALVADLGLNGTQIASTVRSLIAGEVATQFETAGDRYDVRVQLPPELRQTAETIAHAQVRTPAGGLVEVGSVAKIHEGSGPTQIDHEARQRQISVLANLDGKVLGDALDQVEAIAAKEVPSSMTYAFGGNGKMLQESISSMLLALFLAVICVYMILASQFESFVHPFTIMASLPFSLIGAFGALLITGMSMSIFAMIGLIMLMGLVTKNAILLIDFAIQRRADGETINLALENAGATRLRPILMTTAAMIFGMLPVAIGHGDGGETRAPMGVIVIGGLITSTVLTLVVVPVLYNLVESLLGRGRALLGRLSARKGRRPDGHAEAWDEGEGEGAEVFAKAHGAPVGAADGQGRS